MQPQPATPSLDFGGIYVRRERGFRHKSFRTFNVEEDEDMCEFNELVELGDEELAQVCGGGPIFEAETSDIITPADTRRYPVRAPKYPPNPAR
jgi:hypothetical protein